MDHKELKTLYTLLFADYPDIVNIHQMQTMLGISRHAAYDLLNKGEIGAIRLGNAYKIPKINVIRYVLDKARENAKEQKTMQNADLSALLAQAAK